MLRLPKKLMGCSLPSDRCLCFIIFSAAWGVPSFFDRMKFKEIELSYYWSCWNWYYNRIFIYHMMVLSFLLIQGVIWRGLPVWTRNYSFQIHWHKKGRETLGINTTAARGSVRVVLLLANGGVSLEGPRWPMQLHLFWGEFEVSECWCHSVF